MNRQFSHFRNNYRDFISTKNELTQVDRVH